MPLPLVLAFRRIALTFSLACSLLAAAQAQTYSWSLSEPGLTSAGIYDASGGLTRVLWTMKKLPAGSYQSTWDGLKDDGTPASPGDYTWNVVVNRTIYKNIGAVGNTGEPTVSFGHIPYLIEGVAVDATDNIYTVHDWNEAGHDINRWSPTSGQAVYNTGHIIPESLLKGIAVEPDGSYAYVTGYGGNDVNDRSSVNFSIYRVRLDPQQPTVADFTQAGRCITVYNGNAQYPPTAAAADIEVMKVPLVSIALQGNYLYVTDALAGRVLKYNKVTGALEQQILGIPLACGIAIAADGTIWVGSCHTQIRNYSAAGKLLATAVTNLKEVRALSIQGSTMAVADRTGFVRKYQIASKRATLTGTFGQAARPGDNTPDRLFNINGMALDSTGAVIISDRMGEGSRLQKLDSYNLPVWQQMGLEFSGQAAFGKENPDLLVSSYRNLYHIDRATGNWTFLGSGMTDTPGSFFGNFESTHFGPPRVVRFKNNDFFYYPAGDSMAIYRIMPPASADRGPTLKLASCLAASLPGPDGIAHTQLWLDENKYLWSWNDTTGDGKIQYTSPSAPGEVKLDASPNSPPGWKWDKASMGVDDAGWIWLASYAHIIPPGPFEAKAIYAIPPHGLNAQGNPIYLWADAVKVMDEDTGRAAAGMSPGQEFNWMMVNRSDDGMVYSLAFGDRPGLPQNGARWMGGNVLFGWDSKSAASPSPLGAPKWHVTLPERSVGMTPIPGGPGGVFVGIYPWNRATIGHYTKNGLLIGSFNADTVFGDDNPPNLASGALDSFLALNCNRDPRDGIIDVFAEDNWNSRILWYRVDDSAIQTLSGTFSPGEENSAARYPLTVAGGTGDGSYPENAVVNIAAVVPPAGKSFKAWTGDTSGLADIHSPNTTLTMPAQAVTVTATYDWTTGPDLIRFYPNYGSEHRLLNCIFEGTNGDPVTGPYTPFYQVPSIPAPGWSEISADLGNYRYLRFRDPETNGMVAEVEFYRSGNKVTGTGYGTPGSWGNEPDHTYLAALDGNTETFFNGPAGKNTYVGIDSLGATAAAHTLTVNGGSGTGRYDTGMSVTITANPPPSGQHFAGWTGDIPVLSNPAAATTTVLMPSLNVTVTATYAP